MNNVSIKMRLILTLGFLSTLLVAIGLMGLNGMNQSTQGLETVYNDRVVPLKGIKLIADTYAVNIVDTAHKVRNGNLTWEQGLANAEEARTIIKREWDAYLGTVLVAEEERLVAEIKPLMKIADEHVAELEDFLTRRDAEGLAKWTISELYNGIDPISGKFSELVDVQLVVAKREYDQANATFTTISTTTIVSIVIGVLLAGVAGFFLVRAIIAPLNKAVELAESIASGDLTHTIEVNSRNEIGLLLHALKDMNSKLQEIVGSVIEGSNEVTTGADEIARGNADLSQRTEEQASSLEETASSMEEMTSTVKQNADNARQANQLAASARDEAEKGGEVVGRAVHAMAEINSSSKKIADIISVIDEIAFQTNLLALNAAVEAARAGEQGRGFAVVAGEVRTLAGRSAAAAKEIKGLIADSVEKVEHGSALVDESGKTLAEIVAGVKKVTDIVSEMAAATQEQASGIEQVNKAVMQMDEMTQQNAALVEEAAAASEAMQEQARSLNQQISFFRMDSSTSRSRPAERRGGNRPFVANKPRSAAPKQKAAEPPVQQEKMVTKKTGTHDDEWSEF